MLNRSTRYVGVVKLPMIGETIARRKSVSASLQPS